MNRRSLVILAGLAAALAVVLLLSRVDFNRGGDMSGLHAPGLAERLADLESLRVVHAGNEVLATIRRSGGGWTVDENGGHPVNFERFRGVLNALSQARRVERKTALPEFYPRLGVEDPAAPDAAGYLLELEYGGRHPSEGFIVGRRAGTGMAYIRTAGETQSWMVSADFDLSDVRRDWLDRDVVNLASSQVRRVLLDRGGGDLLEIAKEDADAINFTPLGIPEGRELSYGSVANSIAGALANVQANDVRPAAEVVPLPRAATASYETFDGLRLNLDVREEAPAAAEDSGEEDPRYWVLFSAAALQAPAAVSDVDSNAESLHEAPGDAAEETEEPSATTDADEAGLEVAGEASEEPTPATEEPAPSADARAAELNAKLGGWAYELPEFKSDQLFRKMDDLLKDE